MPLNKVDYTKQIGRYFSGKLSDREKFDLEKAALDDPFLQDAMDGFSASPDAVAHYNSKLKRRGSGRNIYYWSGLVAIGITALILIFRPETPIENQDMSLPVAEEKVAGHSTHEITEHEIEVIPAEIEVLKDIDTEEQIVTSALAEDFSQNKNLPGTRRYAGL